MAKTTKKTETQEPVVEQKAPEAPKEVLFAVKVEGSFEDGNLTPFFKQYGYASLWAPGEIRKIPMWLIKRVEQSGGKFVDVE